MLGFTFPATASVNTTLVAKKRNIGTFVLFLVGSGEVSYFQTPDLNPTIPEYNY